MTLFRCLNNRLLHDEKLFAASFLLGGLVDGMCQPLSVGFTDYCDRKISEIVFGKDGSRFMTSHSSRKGGATSTFQACLSKEDLLILGR